MKKKLIALLSLLLPLSACVQPTETVTTGPTGKKTVTTGPTGKKMITAKCSQSPSGCYASASNTCSGSYQVLDSYSKAGGLVADVIPGPVTWYYMTYQCGPSNGRLPTFGFKGQQYTPPAVVTLSKPTTTTCSLLWQTVTCNSY